MDRLATDDVNEIERIYNALTTMDKVAEIFLDLPARADTLYGSICARMLASIKKRYLRNFISASEACEAIVRIKERANKELAELIGG